MGRVPGDRMSGFMLRPGPDSCVAQADGAAPVPPADLLLLFLPLLGGASVIFVVTSFYFNPAAFLMPLVPLIRLAYPDYRPRRLQVSAEVLLSLAVVAVAAFQPAPDGAWSSPYNYAGGPVTAGLLMARWANRDHTTSKRRMPHNRAVL